MFQKKSKFDPKEADKDGKHGMDEKRKMKRKNKKRSKRGRY